MRLNGAGSFVDITGQSGLSHLGDATFEAWVHPVGPGTATNGGILFNKDQSFEIARYPNGEIKFAFAIEGVKGWVWTATGRSIPANQWSHVAVSRSAKTGVVKVFINGQPAVRLLPGDGAGGGASSVTVDGAPAARHAAVRRRDRPTRARPEKHVLRL